MVPEWSLLILVVGALESERPPQLGLLTRESCSFGSCPQLFSPKPSIQAFFFTPLQHSVWAVIKKEEKTGAVVLY